MTQSTNAILFYGYCWDEETAKPWTIGKDSDDEDDNAKEAWEERYARLKGIAQPTVPYPQTRDSRGNERTDLTQSERDARDLYQAYWAQKREVVKESGCDVGLHCSGDCPMPYVCVTKSEVTSYRGDMSRINSLDTEKDWNDKLADFCHVLGIDVSKMKPAWWMVSYWS